MGLISLDDVRASEPECVGAKAARLAEGRGAGLPVLPGFVVPAAVGDGGLRRGMDQMGGGGRSAAALAVADVALDDGFVDELVAAGRGLGAELVVRSSSPWEADGRWSGAFTSYIGVAPDELPVAVRGCWASVFGRDVLERCEAMGLAPDQLRLAVLVQPAVTPSTAGLARLEPDGTVAVTITSGSPAALFQGLESGLTVHVTPGTAASPSDAKDDPAVGPPSWRRAVSLAERAAELACRVADTLGDDTIEWAATASDSGDDRLVLLQSRPAMSPRGDGLGGASATGAADGAMTWDATVRHGGDDAAAALARRIACRVARFRGPLGEELVLPWVVASAALPAPSLAPAMAEAAEPQVLVERAIRRAGELTVAAWGRPLDQARVAARQAFAALRSARSDVALRQLAGLRPVDAAHAAELLALLDAVGERLAAAALLSWPQAHWQLPPAALQTAATSGTAGRPQTDSSAGRGFGLRGSDAVGPPPAGGWQARGPQADGAAGHGSDHMTLGAAGGPPVDGAAGHGPSARTAGAPRRPPADGRAVGGPRRPPADSPAVGPLSARRALPDAWEPFLYATAAAQGRQAVGRGASAGLGAGRVCLVGEGAPPAALRSRDVLVARRPLASLAPLLWKAAALVTLEGGPGAHLLEVARSLGVPAVTGCGLEVARSLGVPAVTGCRIDEAVPAGGLLAVDGDAGVVAILPDE